MESGSLYNRVMTPQDVQLLERVTVQPGLMVGKPTLRGLRITVAQLLMALAHGVSEDALLEDYPELEREDIRAALLYAGTIVADERVFALSATP